MNVFLVLLQTLKMVAILFNVCSETVEASFCH